MARKESGTGRGRKKWRIETGRSERRGRGERGKGKGKGRKKGKEKFVGKEGRTFPMQILVLGAALKTNFTTRDKYF